jgi:hypothetical protein
MYDTKEALHTHKDRIQPYARTFTSNAQQYAYTHAHTHACKLEHTQTHTPIASAGENHTGKSDRIRVQWNAQ